MEEIVKRVRYLLFGNDELVQRGRLLFISYKLYQNDAILQDFVEYVNPFGTEETPPFFRTLGPTDFGRNLYILTGQEIEIQRAYENNKEIERQRLYGNYVTL